MKGIKFFAVIAVALMPIPAAAFAGTEAAATTQSRMMLAVADALNADGRFDAEVLVAGVLSGDTNALVTQAKMGVPLVVPSDPGRPVRMPRS